MDNTHSANSGHGNNFFSGFLLGALVGAAIVLLFVTKKGKKILKAISEEGEGKLSNILDKIENSVDLETESLDRDEIETVVPKKEIVKKINLEEKPKIARRFFRGISRHAN